MSNSEQHVSLSVQNGNYQYSGGNNGDGNVEFGVGKGPSKIHISLAAEPNYFIKRVELQGENTNQFSTEVTGNKLKAKIDDKCSEPANVKYTVVVGDSNGGADVMCDPQVVNR